jgi:hypothetical protein
VLEINDDELGDLEDLESENDDFGAGLVATEPSTRDNGRAHDESMMMQGMCTSKC